MRAQLTVRFGVLIPATHLGSQTWYLWLIPRRSNRSLAKPWSLAVDVFKLIIGPILADHMKKSVALSENQFLLNGQKLDDTANTLRRCHKCYIIKENLQNALVVKMFTTVRKYAKRMIGSATKKSAAINCHEDNPIW